MEVPELQKPERRSCNHLTGISGKQCGIYNDPAKPGVCSSFKCGWLLGAFGDADRPDLTGLIWTLKPSAIGVVFVAFETRPHAQMEVRNERIIAGLSDERIIVVIRYAGGTTLYGPQEDMERVRPLLEKMGLGVL